MKKDKKINLETPRSFKVLYQLLCVSGINFEQELLFGFTELTLIPLTEDLHHLKLNCSSQIQITSVFVNDLVAGFNQQDPLESVFGPTSANSYLDPSGYDGGNRNHRPRRDLKFFSEAYFEAASSTDPEWGGGELTIKLPAAVEPLVRALKSLKVCLEFRVERPSVALHFVVPSTRRTRRTDKFESGDDTALGLSSRDECRSGLARPSAPAHLFTYRSRLFTSN